MLIEFNEVIHMLEERFPNKLPDSFIAEKDLAFLQGQQYAIRYLKEKMNSLTPKEPKQSLTTQYKLKQKLIKEQGVLSSTKG